MTRDDIKDLADDELIRRADEAYSDLYRAAADEPNSEWHSACFAAFLTLGFEMQRRGLRRGPIH